MVASAISELSASKTPTWVAAGYFKDAVQIWDVSSRVKVTEFPTDYCSGARNLAFAPSAQIVVAGLSTDHGKVTAYEVPSGKPLWEQKLAYPSLLRFDLSGESVLCSSADRSSFRLDVQTGVIIQKIEGVSHYFEGPYGDILSVPARNRNGAFRLVSRGHNFEVARRSFALLDAQFSPDSICLSEAVGPVRCINCTDGTERWRFDPGADSHVLRLHYSSGMDAFFGVLRHLGKGGSRQLVRFETQSGIHSRICDLDSWDEVFLDTIDQLVTSAGEIRNLLNGVLVDRLAFPVREYPGD